MEITYTHLESAQKALALNGHPFSPQYFGIIIGVFSGTLKRNSNTTTTQFVNQPSSNQSNHMFQSHSSPRGILHSRETYPILDKPIAPNPIIGSSFGNSTNGASHQNGYSGMSNQNALGIQAYPNVTQITRQSLITHGASDQSVLQNESHAPSKGIFDSIYTSMFGNQ